MIDLGIASLNEYNVCIIESPAHLLHPLKCGSQCFGTTESSCCVSDFLWDPLAVATHVWPGQKLNGIRTCTMIFMSNIF